MTTNAGNSGASNDGAAISASSQSDPYVNSLMMGQLTTKPNQKDSHFACLRVCMVVSLLGFVVSFVAHLPPMGVMVIGALPLIYYHLIYLRKRAAQGISQTAIDSVYYYGFLITIGALALSAVTVARTGEAANLNEVAFQFGLGLLATGYAVFARMHLSSINAGAHELSAEAILDRYSQRSTELVTNVELASEQFATMAVSLASKTERVVEDAHRTLRESLTELTKIFDEQMRATLASSREAVTEVRALVHDTSFAIEREEMVKSLRTSIEVVGSLNSAMTMMSRQITENVGQAAKLGTYTAEAAARLEGVSEQLSLLGAEDGRLARTSSALLDTTEDLMEGARHMRAHVADVGEMVESVKGSVPTFKSLRAMSSKLGEQLTSLIDASDQLATASGRIAAVSADYDKLASNIRGAQEGAPLANQQLEALGRQVQALTDQLGALAQASTPVERPVADLNRLSTELAGALDVVVKAAASLQSSAAQAAQQAQNQAQTQIQTMERVQQASAGIQDAKLVQGQAQQALTAMTEQVRGFSQELSAATAQVRSTVGAALSALEGDVRRTGELSHLFGEKMNGVAQYLLDEAQKRRPA